METQQPQEAQPSEENVPDWLKSIRQNQEETAQPAESEPATPPETPGGLESVLLQEAAIESNAAPEATKAEVPVMDSSIEPPTVASSHRRSRGFPGFPDGYGCPCGSLRLRLLLKQ